MTNRRRILDLVSKEPIRRLKAKNRIHLKVTGANHPGRRNPIMDRVRFNIQQIQFASNQDQRKAVHVSKARRYSPGFFASGKWR